MLAQEKRIVYFVFQVHHVVKVGSVAGKTTLCIGREVSAAPDPYEATVYHKLHGLTQATSEADGPVAVRERFLQF
jgi:hypothetical protein